ncbi:carboxymuconolactone decarboxylase family protein [Kribbella shirazensis]|uniref:AhpD family alkylhydroperoxidase n=1 Tax=Kribbella shirazensis TaxID=1105143 RepID=A0A7X5ZZS5_9ACTN|nr:carboxymuconolactone decarboxylase family protein [Kribbella shirazensis]NIK56015.1 AhpD family alkylhydroperoxidase [Kribbella shirazensis]
MEPRIDLMNNEFGMKLAKRLYAVHGLVQQAGLPHATQSLVMLRASQINGCGHCIDLHTKEAAAEGETATRLHLVAGWRHSTVFTEEEQAALALTEEATRLADASEGVSDETWARASKYYAEDQLIALVTLIAMINATNRLAVTLNQLGGSYEPGVLASAASS